MKKFSLLSVVFVFLLSFTQTSLASGDYGRVSSDDSLEAPQAKQYFKTLPNRNDILRAAEEIGIQGQAADELTKMLDLLFRPGVPQPTEDTGTMLRRWNGLFDSLEGKDESEQAQFFLQQTRMHEKIFVRHSRPRQFETAQQ